MKYFFTFLIIISIENSLGAPCNGAPGKFHVNPDGSQGGFVQNTARVTDSSYIDETSEICDKVVIKGTNQILNGSKIVDEVIIEGNSIIRDSSLSQFARIKGRSIIQTSKICQTSLVESLKLNDSDFFCQTEDFEPKNPGETGLETLLGVDTDADGVRDDIEIFINQKIPNVVGKDKSIERKAAKLVAQIMQKEILLNQTTAKLNDLYKLKTETYACYPIKISEDLIVEFYNTEERLKTLFKILGVFHGKEIYAPTQKCSSIDKFHARLSRISSR